MRYVYSLRYWYWNRAGYVNRVGFGDNDWDWLVHRIGNGTFHFDRYGMWHRYGNLASDGKGLRYGNRNWNYVIHDISVNVMYRSVYYTNAVTWCVYSVTVWRSPYDFDSSPVPISIPGSVPISISGSVPVSVFISMPISVSISVPIFMTMQHIAAMVRYVATMSIYR